jgi:hypothetical protein
LVLWCFCCKICSKVMCLRRDWFWTAFWDMKTMILFYPIYIYIYSLATRWALDNFKFCLLKKRLRLFIVESIMAMNFAKYIYIQFLLCHERLQIANLKGLFYNWKHDAINYAPNFILFKFLGLSNTSNWLERLFALENMMWWNLSNKNRCLELSKDHYFAMVCMQRF